MCDALTPTDKDLWHKATADVMPLGVPHGGRRRGLETARDAAPKARAHGTLRIKARLDLHGMTLCQAHVALADFVTKTPHRCVLIITGASGALCKEVPLWLEVPALAHRIISIIPAPPDYGGTGALIVRLRTLQE